MSTLSFTLPLIVAALAAVAFLLLRQRARRQAEAGPHRLQPHGGPEVWIDEQQPAHPADELFRGDLDLKVDTSAEAEAERQRWHEAAHERDRQSGWFR
jgi:hypothetical protein